MTEKKFDPWWHIAKMDKTKREVHLETLLMMALPYLEREELSTRTHAFTRHLINEIKGQIGG